MSPSSSGGSMRSVSPVNKNLKLSKFVPTSPGPNHLSVTIRMGPFY